MDAIHATACQPRKRGRGMETAATARRRGMVDRAIAGLLFHGGLRRSEAAALTWSAVAEAPSTADALLVTVGTSKPNPDGSRADVRLVKGDCAAAAKATGIKGRITSHSGRIGLATELTRRGASLQEVMLAGNWSTARMVAHYCAEARAEAGAVAKYL